MLAHDLKKVEIAVIGLGYVGLPLAVEFGKKYKTIGFDINQSRIDELKNGYDRTRETSGEDLVSSVYLQYESNAQALAANVYIVTVPTPIDAYKKPDLTPLIKASETVGKVLKQGDVIIYESTVYPGCTEEDCVPILERFSGLKFNEGFYCGYSPERINPGDKERTLTKILKITSGSTPEIADFVDDLYNDILEAGTHKAPSIKVAEAAKLIENCQRDVNISFVNELALIFDRMGIDTTEVLEAAGSKWNFLKFKPGLVGGHCIGVDPYYMIHKAESLGYFPAVIGAGRRINDNMGIFVANKVIKLMIQKGIQIKGAKALILGITFKENCPDIRNTRVVDIYAELKEYGLDIDIYDPWADKEDVKHEYGLDLSKSFGNNYQAIILAVSHDEFLNIDMKSLSSQDFVFFDIKAVVNKNVVDARL
jgi:UDP-N-acetyl-D-glucosamine/UDP-N-acetyl-D-galactosamine dehydrogenase